MEKIEANLASRMEPALLYHVIGAYEKRGIRSQLGFLCTYYNSYSRAFQIADFDRDRGLIEGLEQRGYIMMDWGQYRITENLAILSTRDELLIELRGRTREMRRDLDWLEASFDRVKLHGDRLRLPPTDAFLLAEIHGLRRFEKLELALRKSKTWGD